MRRIVLLWLLLTPVWIAFSFYGSASKIAFLPPALIVVAAVLYWLHRQFVLLVAGEAEPRANVQPSPRSLFRPVAAASLVRPALVAVGVGACVGAAATPFFHFDRAFHDSAVLNNSTAPAATAPNSTVSLQTEAMKPQSASATPKAVQTEAVTPQPALAQPNSGAPKTVQTEAVKPQAASAQPNSATPKNQDNPTSSENPDAKRAEAQILAGGQSSTGQPRCNVSLCESSYQSFRASDCTYQPYSGPRQYCAR